MATITKITFDEILPIWRDQLWPGRVSPVETHSAMMYLSNDYSMANFECPAVFFGAFQSGKIIGVNSVHGCSDGTWRSRGLWVAPDYRGRNIGGELLASSIATAKDNGALFLWSMPRQTAWSVYRKCGFTLASEWTATETSAANAYAICHLDKIDSTPKVWLLDSPEGHAEQITELLRGKGVENIELVQVGPKITTSRLVEVVNTLTKEVQPADIVLCPWAISGDRFIDHLFEVLTQRCTVVAAAGNSGVSIDGWTPARVHSVITVGSLNKCGVRASHSNWSNEKSLKYSSGTNIEIGGKLYNGTSIAAANYTAKLLTT